MRKLNIIQQNLLTAIKPYIGINCPIKYDILKSLVNFKSFDSTFNVLINKGYVERFETNDFSNQFKLTN